MTTTKQIGDRGEIIAVDYLTAKGYEVVDRNWHFGKKEIDIICYRDNMVVFVEVKCRQDYNRETAQSSITRIKEGHLIEAAEAYLIERDLDCEARFDVITVIFNEDAQIDIDHFEAAIIPS